MKKQRVSKPSPKSPPAAAGPDAEERRIEGEPKEVLSEVTRKFSEAKDLLLKLIRSGKLHCMESGPKGGADIPWDDACWQMQLVTRGFMRQLVELAWEGFPLMRETVFSEANRLAEAFVRLAQAYPGDFVSFAETSLTMPSLRAKSGDFTCDAEAIAKAIHLAEKHPVADISDNRSRAGALCHLLVARLMERIHEGRALYDFKVRVWQSLRDNPRAHEYYRIMTLEEYFLDSLREDLLAHVKACGALPPWEDNPEAWWKGRMLALLREEFDEMGCQPERHKALWEELERGGEFRNSTLKGKRRYLEKLCYNKFMQLVRAARRKPAHGQRA